MVEKREEIEFLVCPSGPGNARNSEASVLELKDGSLLLVYSHYYTDGHEDLHPSDIRKKISPDGGRTWSEAEVIQENDAYTNLHSVSLLRLPSGRIGLFYQRNGIWGKDRERARRRGHPLPMEEDAYYESYCVFRNSSDEGRTWSEDRVINPPQESVALLRNDSALVLSDGRLLAPVTVIASPFGNYEMALCLYSDDEGETWHSARTRVVVPGTLDGACEPQIVELKDGRLMMMLRNTSGRIWKSFSEDRGVTWNKPEPTELASSYSPITLKRIPSTDDLLLIWNQASLEEMNVKVASRPPGFKMIARHRLTCAISRDEGKTWENFKNLESLDKITRVSPPPLRPGERIIQPTEHKDYSLEKMVEGRYTNCSYCSATFIQGGKKAVLTYDVSPSPYFSLKLRILPVEWFYE